MSTPYACVEIGTHRGAECIFTELQRRAARVARVTLADVKPGRAAALAERYRTMGAVTDAYEERGELVVRRSDPALPVLQTTDDLRTMAEVIGEQHRTILSQGVVRGAQTAEMPPPVIGLTLAAFPTRPDERLSHTQLLQTLATLSPPQTSAVFRVSATDAGRLALARCAVSRASVAHLLDLPRLRDAPSLGHLWWGNASFALAVVPTAETDLRHRMRLAESVTAGRRPVAVALVTHGVRVEFVVMDSFRGARSTPRLFLSFERLLAAPSTAPRALTRPAAFTD